MRKALHIAVGVLTNASGEVLIAQRQAGQAGAGEWEFAGGKRHPGETLEDALRRELIEELGITVQSCSPLIRIRHDYPDRRVLLDTWRITDFDGQPHGAEGQAIAWVQPEALPHAGLLAADAPIANALRLPQRYAMTPPDAEMDDVLTWLSAPKASMLRVRLPSLPDADYWGGWSSDLRRAAQTSQVTLVADRLPPETIAAPVSVHVSAAQAAAMTVRPAGSHWFACSCHSPRELRHAARLGADFAVLGHVQATPTHADHAPLGWTRWQGMADAAQVPVYAIGGMRLADLEVAVMHGGQGIAAIRDFWW